MSDTAEQQARDMLERMGVKDAQSFSAGDLVELAGLIADRDAVSTMAMVLPQNSTAMLTFSTEGPARVRLTRIASDKRDTQAGDVECFGVAVGPSDPE